MGREEEVDREVTPNLEASQIPEANSTSILNPTDDDDGKPKPLSTKLKGFTAAAIFYGNVAFVRSSLFNPKNIVFINFFVIFLYNF